MDFLYNFFLVLHFVGWAIVLGGYIATIKQPEVYRGTLHGALTALVSGIAMVGIGEMGDRDFNMVKIGIKLTVALVVVILALIAKNRPEVAKPGIKHAIGGLTVVNIVLAVFI
ncbi:hypothetical protein SAMN06309944_0800 [Micrococcales bacterium KH10]|nr:hypothetical protein SAMN06309944_0800 [Micrococcales bacterium KH10]